MSELTTERVGRANFRWQLMATVSMLTLLGTALHEANAADAAADRPTVWIELGGQLERLDGTADRFTAPFVVKNAQINAFSQASPIEAQTPPRYTYGGEGKISFRPTDSDWVFSAGLKFGRSNGKKHVHHQTSITHPPLVFFGHVLHSAPATLADFADAKTRQNESHSILDFQVGKDVGLGLFGHEGMSTIGAGVRFGQFSSSAQAAIYARPDLQWYDRYPNTANRYAANPKFHVYTAAGNITHSFRGVGPSLSWNASAPVLGHADTAELTFDWGLNGAVLFGRQKTTGHHQTTARYFRNNLYNNDVPGAGSNKSHYNVLYHNGANPARARSVVVPNIGAFAGVSLKFPNAKVSFGYRADMFFGALDAGIDAHKSQNVAFHGPFASIGIGFR